MPGRRLRGQPKVATTTYCSFPSCFAFERSAAERFLEEVRKAFGRGDVIIVSHKARTPKGRAELTAQMRQANLEPEIVAVLGWATVMPEPEPIAVPKAEPPAEDWA